jgi:hypothetical protein
MDCRIAYGSESPHEQVFDSFHSCSKYCIDELRRLNEDLDLRPVSVTSIAPCARSTGVQSGRALTNVELTVYVDQIPKNWSLFAN